MTIPVTGEQYEIAAGSLRATVTEMGAGLRTLYDRDRPLLDGYDADEMAPGANGHVLLPWPNRVDHGRYTFGGQSHQLDLTEPAAANAIHGLVRWSSWRLVEHLPYHVELAHRLHGHPGYPHVLDLSISYTLDRDRGLTAAVHAANVGSTPAPYGNGAHPYLTAGAERVDECVLTAPGATWLPVDDRAIPTGREPAAGTPYDFRKARRIGDVRVNYAYTDLARDPAGRAWAHLRAPDGHTVSLWVDEKYPWIQVYTGDELPQGLERRGLGVEPMSCPPNAFVTGEDVLTLKPGDTTTSRWGIIAS